MGGSGGVEVLRVFRVIGKRSNLFNFTVAPVLTDVTIVRVKCIFSPMDSD